MLPYRRLLLLLTLTIVLGKQLAAQTAPDCRYIYFVKTDGSPAPVSIYAYNPALPVSATNPAVVTGVAPLPPLSNALAISPVLGSGNPTPTFYSIDYSTSNYLYYNIATNTWVNTGHHRSAINMGGGGGYIFNTDVAGHVYRYDGTGNDVLIATITDWSGDSPLDVVVDAEGNWYLFNQTGGFSTRFLRKYSPSGALLKSWTVNSPPINTVQAFGGFAIIGNKLYCDNLSTGTPSISEFFIGENTVDYVGTTAPLSVAQFSMLADFAQVADNVQPLPVITITSSQNGCFSLPVTFNASPVLPTTDITYHWMINGINQGTNSPTFTITTASNNDVITCSITNTAPCANGNTVVSNAIQLSFNSPATPGINIAASSTNICPGASVTFTATPTNGGTTPVYQWKINGANAGTNSATFTYNSFANNDIVTCELTSNAACITTSNALSNPIQITIKPTVTPAINISASSSTICFGTAVTFTASSTNGGTAPVYQWKVNGTNAGTNNNIFIKSDLNNNDIVTCVLTSNADCLASNNPASNAIQINVTPTVAPSINITSSFVTICSGTAVTFTASPTNGGSAPVYQWKLNGTNVGSNSNTFTKSDLANDDEITCTLTSNAACVISNIVTSNTIKIKVYPIATPAITISSTATEICAGTPVRFTATVVNGGTTPAYQWKVNGFDVANNGNTFITNILANNDEVTCSLVSNAACLTDNNVVSNAIKIKVNAPVTPAVTITAAATTICKNDPVTFTATPVNGGTSPVFQWFKNGQATGNGGNILIASNFSSGDIVKCTISVTDPCASVLSAESNPVTITIAPDPVVTMGNDEHILAGSSVQLGATVTGNISQYSWSPGNSLNNPALLHPVASPVATTQYKLEATSDHGCKGYGSMTVFVETVLRIPNTFTPNNDGINDKWVISTLSVYPNCRVRIFTRAGQKVFESRGYHIPWDGNSKGKSLPADTYYYIIETGNADAPPIKGYVTIIK